LAQERVCVGDRLAHVRSFVIRRDHAS
jgi:hypothetical protein